MGSTPKFNIHWPEQVEGNDISEHLRTMALDVEAGLQVAGRLVSQTFTASGTWTKLFGALWVGIEMWGAGGAGSNCIGGSDSVTGDRSAGGGGGERQTLWIPAAMLPATVPIVVGAGGLFSTNTDGGESSFGSYLRARGGKTANNSASGAFPGDGGGQVTFTAQGGPVLLATDDTGARGGTVAVRGGGGGAGFPGSSPNGQPGRDGGGTGTDATGGGAAGTSASLNGKPGTSRTSGPLGGAGGGSGGRNADGTIGGNGGPGGTPGGGGGGGGFGTDVSGVGGPGARGEVRVYTLCTGK